MSGGKRKALTTSAAEGSARATATYLKDKHQIEAHEDDEEDDKKPQQKKQLDEKRNRLTHSENGVSDYKLFLHYLLLMFL